ncbi:cytochrome P450 94B3-like protein [Carex littledalei]|uniref:Cytochrome P450 94B3-like protein n=1 Tax=Carex littledalei TaxID=544730 RepID=A0A833QQ60_9POAL|nr:cytochrome P450 94B3-like protein [Carex littledalei]
MLLTVISASHLCWLRFFLVVAEKGVKVELQDVLAGFLFDNICRVVIGEEPVCLTEEWFSDISSSKQFMAAFYDAQELSAARFLVPFEHVWRIKRFLNIGTEKRLKKALSIVHGYTMKIIRSRMLEGMELDGREDMLSRFSAARFFGSYMVLLADIERKIIDEIKFMRISNRITSETLSFHELRDMNYLHAAITELMKLYPAVPLDTVSCKDDDVMPDGTFVGK